MPDAEHRQGLRISQPVLDDADVMRSEIPEGVDVGADAPQVETLAVDVADSPSSPASISSLRSARRR